MFIIIMLHLHTDFSFLEMNPFAVVNGEPYPLDIRGELDDTTAFKKFKKWIRFPRDTMACTVLQKESKYVDEAFISWLPLLLFCLFRDGISEGQFNHVLILEMDAIRKAYASLEDGYLPPVTFVIIQKRHHTRLFPGVHGRRDVTDRSGNILPG
jgi:hypothetical protein